jgi:bifunctional UDP-N-acetylglucosamine pyrophosphorylase/glucosamine-1-phosphate N-acetyltransferase/UDP-N-acetylglucosamine pyrophosphorylase
MAAGKGTRMKSDLPKVLFPVAGRPMIDYVLDALRAGGVRRIIVVVGYRADLVREHLAGQPDLAFVEQSPQMGTGHAVMVCRDALADHWGPVLIVTGDSPLMQPVTIRALFAEFDKHQPACLLGTANKDDSRGLGRIVRDGTGAFQAIVEEKDATDEQRRITEVNMSCYVFDNVELLHALGEIKNNNAQGEYYITDCPGVLKSEGKDVRALAVLQPCETLSINTIDELGVVEQELRRLKLV